MLTPEGYDDRLVEEGLHTFFIDGLTESGIGGIVGREQVVPDRKRSMLVFDFERPAWLILQPNAVPVIVDLPYAMLASLEAEAQSRKIGNIVRAALVTAGHDTADDIIGIKSDRYTTEEEQRELIAAARSR